MLITHLWAPNEQIHVIESLVAAEHQFVDPLEILLMQTHVVPAHERRWTT
jgi:hypothetical protein